MRGQLSQTLTLEREDSGGDGGRDGTGRLGNRPTIVLGNCPPMGRESVDSNCKCKIKQ